MDVADYAAFPGFADDPRSRIWNLWGYIDARDGALAVRLALESDLTGFEAFIVASPDTVLETPSADLVAQYFPDVPVTPADRGPRDAPVHRQGAPAARLRPAAQLARRGLTAGGEDSLTRATSRGRVAPGVRDDGAARDGLSGAR